MKASLTSRRLINAAQSAGSSALPGSLPALEAGQRRHITGHTLHIGETIETLESQIPTGDIRPWEVRRRYKLVHDQEKRAGAWNEMRIVARGRTVDVRVNGTHVNRGWNGTATDGAICLQAEKSDIEFRSIRIRKDG
jgi:hypothetical protein